MVIALLATDALAGSESQFDTHWYDGKAEVDGYRLSVSRYGQKRVGRAVLVYVTEPFSKKKRVKVDDWKKNPDDTFNVLKLNLVRDFQTGIYDYNTMVSVFSRTSDLTPVKVTFTSAEWCGNIYEQLIFRDNRISGHYYSYFEDESGAIDITEPDGAIIEDNLFILLRGLREDYLEPGQHKTVQMLPGAYFTRLSHKKRQWVKTEIRRSKALETIDVPAGTFETSLYEVETSDGRDGKFYVESAYPHRIIRWEMFPDLEAELAGSARLKYWTLNKNGDESYLKKLGF